MIELTEQLRTVLFDDQATEEEILERRLTPSDRRLVDLLRKIPVVFSFEYRALLFHALIQQRDASADPFLVRVVTKTALAC